MVSKTRMLELVKAHDAAAVDAALTESPTLKDVRDEKGRNWLHVACGSPPKGDPAASLATADVLLRHGFGLDDPAFLEGEWKATPLWYTVSRGRNPALSEHLLKLGCDPNHCLWAAVWNDDPDVLRLLLRYGANIEGAAVTDETPLLWGVKWSKFACAEVLLEAGADPDTKDKAGRTALHCMLKKGSDPAHIAMLLRHAARTDIPDGEGRTAREILAKKRDPALRRLAEA